MKVKELLAILQRVDPELEVEVEKLMDHDGAYRPRPLTDEDVTIGDVVYISIDSEV